MVVVYVGKIPGLTRSPTRGSDPVAPLKVTSGTQDIRLSPSLSISNPDSHVSTGISQLAPMAAVLLTGYLTGLLTYINGRVCLVRLKLFRFKIPQFKFHSKKRMSLLKLSDE